ncbi:hypothetical protein PVL29_001243 [Vitis rotundifolia]|uniref:DELLA protein RGL1 n=1 Tax=Vitis rotundifolia TaxID=103349 RepID=A0AA39AL45_VITRO|nr:hypothetical protein PVL29_001243 [Vitis rotundifolia]
MSWNLHQNKINLLAESMGVLHCMYFDTTENQMAHDLYLPTEFHNGERRNEASALSLSLSAMAGSPFPYLDTLMDTSSTWFIPFSDATRNHKRLKQGLGTDQSIRSNSYSSLYDDGCNGRTNSLNSLLGLQYQDHTWGNAQRYLAVEAIEEDAAAMLGGGVDEVLKEGSDDGMKLVHQLITCAKVVAFRDKSHASALLSELRANALVFGTSFQRVASCFVQGLSDRLSLIQSLGAVGVGGCTVKTMDVTPEKEEAFRLFFEICPQIQFGHLAANASILEAFEGESSVHVVDLGMNLGLPQGQQWRILMHSLANRAGKPPSSLQITGVGTAAECLKDIIDELEVYAESLGMNFQFSMVESNLENLQPEDINLLEGEAVVVNSILQLHCVVKESRGALNSVLQKIRELSPKAVVLVEQDASHNGPFFLGRFMEALHYYSAIFDSLDAMLPKYDTRRAKIEQFYFAEEIKNIISCEGSARVERHQRLDQWRRRMSRAGFQPSPMRMITEAKQWLEKVKLCDGYTIVDEKGCLVLGWMSKPIIAASCWKCS